MIGTVSAARNQQVGKEHAGTIVQSTTERKHGLMRLLTVHQFLTQFRTDGQPSDCQ